MDIILRPIKLGDLSQYRQCIDPDRRYHLLNGPYFGLPSADNQDNKVQFIRETLSRGEPHFSFELIVDQQSDEIMGEVSFYWKDERTKWLEIGIVIFDEKNWGKGIGGIALPVWINKIFDEKPELARIGLTTWSGNAGMMRLAEKSGLNMEACYRRARIWQGKYFDSVSYGILKEEWTANRAT